MFDRLCIIKRWNHKTSEQLAVWSDTHYVTGMQKSKSSLGFWLICFHPPKHTELCKYIGGGGFGGEGGLTLDTMTLTTRKTLVTRVVTCGGREGHLDVCYNSRPDVLIKGLFFCFFLLLHLFVCVWLTWVHTLTAITHQCFRRKAA